MGLSPSFVPDVILLDLIAAGALAGTPAKGQRQLVGGPDQIFAKRRALGKGLPGIAQRAGVKVDLDVVVAGLAVGGGTARVFLGLQPMQLLNGRDSPPFIREEMTAS